MCGLVAVVSNDDSEIDLGEHNPSSVLSDMIYAIRHRGPDGSGAEFVSDSLAQVGFGHRRLSIIDLSESGKQPMSFQYLTVTYNGEIYNYQEIKVELESLGHVFESSSDTEMILHAFYEWGEECLNKFIGMFAFVIYNKKEQTVFCSRDRTGVKPFFFYWKDDLFLFGSELKAFHEHPSFQKEINLDAVGAFMQYGNVPSSHCIFQN